MVFVKFHHKKEKNRRKELQYIYSKLLIWQTGHKNGRFGKVIFESLKIFGVRRIKNTFTGIRNILSFDFVAIVAQHCVVVLNTIAAVIELDRSFLRGPPWKPRPSGNELAVISSSFVFYGAIRFHIFVNGVCRRD